VRHIVQESRQKVDDLIRYVAVDHEAGDARFIYVTPENGDSQRALNIRLISSFEAVQNDGA
jgi:hypothetical protein